MAVYSQCENLQLVYVLRSTTYLRTNPLDSYVNLQHLTSAYVLHTTTYYNIPHTSTYKIMLQHILGCLFTVWKSPTCLRTTYAESRSSSNPVRISIFWLRHRETFTQTGKLRELELESFRNTGYWDIPIRIIWLFARILIVLPHNKGNGAKHRAPSEIVKLLRTTYC